MLLLLYELEICIIILIVGAGKSAGSKKSGVCKLSVKDLFLRKKCNEEKQYNFLNSQNNYYKTLFNYFKHDFQHWHEIGTKTENENKKEHIKLALMCLKISDY